MAIETDSPSASSWRTCRRPNVALGGGKTVPCCASSFVGRLGVLAQNFITTVAVDTNFLQWLNFKLLYIQLSPVMRDSKYVKWSVKIDPAVGEPFLSSWKAYLVHLRTSAGRR